MTDNNRGQIIHTLKIIPVFFEQYYQPPEIPGDEDIEMYKMFEVRKDDRDYQIGDTLRLMEFDQVTGYTGNSVDMIITHIFGRAEYEKQLNLLQPGVVVLQGDIFNIKVS